MVSRMIFPEVTGATLPGRESAQMAFTPSWAAASKSTPADVEIGSARPPGGTQNSTRGRVVLSSSPPEGTFSALMLPPWALMMLLQMDSPSPDTFRPWSEV